MVYLFIWQVEMKSEEADCSNVTKLHGLLFITPNMHRYWSRLFQYHENAFTSMYNVRLIPEGKE